MKARLLRLLHLAHRWLGTASGVLILAWFVSGLVMLYVPFPKLDTDERVSRQAPLQPDALAVSPAQAATACPGKLRGARLAMALGRPVYHFSGADAACSVWADTGKPVVVTPELARAAAQAFLPGAKLGTIEAILRDQWTIYSTYRPHRPLLRISVDDAAGSVLYVSSRSGEVVAHTTRFERGWSWLGTVPHWLYFTPLRGDDTTLWRQLVLWLPATALLTVAAGLALGLQRLRLRRRYPRGQVTPYRGWKRGHHLLGLGVGALAFTWLLSGWLSNHPFGLLEFSGLPKGAAQRLAGSAFSPAADLALLKRQLTAAPGGREAEWYRFDGRHYLEVRGPDSSRRLDDQARPALPIPPQALADMIAAIEGQPVAQAELIHEADLYHYGRRNPAVLPAVRIRLADPEQTTWYIDPASGRVLSRVDAANRLHRWVFNGLHRLDFPPLGALPALRDGLITLLCLLGAALATSGCVIGMRRLRRQRPQ